LIFAIIFGRAKFKQYFYFCVYSALIGIKLPATLPEEQRDGHDAPQSLI